MCVVENLRWLSQTALGVASRVEMAFSCQSWRGVGFAASLEASLAGGGQDAYAFRMQWMFLILALGAALVELHSGTFYLAAIALIALIIFGLGFFVREEFLLLLFLALSAGAMVAIWVWRRRRRGRDKLADLDLGQVVVVNAAAGADGTLRVRYRGTDWVGEMAAGPAPAIGAAASIIGKRGNVLRLAAIDGASASRSTGDAS